MQPIRLSDAQVAELEAQIRHLQELIGTLDALEECGLDCQQRRFEARQLHDKMQALLRRFGGRS